MNDLTIRPTAKFLKAGAIAAAIVALALDVLYLVYRDEIGAGAWVMALPPLLLLWPAVRALRRKLTQAVIGSDRLRYETGVTSKITRNIQLSKIQDVRVDQRMAQRIFSVGDLSIETAGEASRLTIANVDNPQALADEIMTRAQKGPSV